MWKGLVVVTVGIGVVVVEMEVVEAVVTRGVKVRTEVTYDTRFCGKKHVNQQCCTQYTLKKNQLEKEG